MKEINRYRLALVQYYLSCMLPKSFFRTELGFCWHFKLHLEIVPFKYCLPKLHFLNPNGQMFWFPSGDIKPRIKLLKEAIRLCKQDKVLNLYFSRK